MDDDLRTEDPGDDGRNAREGLSRRRFLGWVGAATIPQMLSRAGVGAVVLLAVGGLLYSAGAVVYALRRPDPRPKVFGYHEIFHVLVIAAAAAHYAAIAGYARPAHA